jgi:hypothetical protein
VKFERRTWFLIQFFSLSTFALTFILRAEFDLYGVSNALLLPGVLLLSYAGLRLITRTGVYDVGGFSVTALKDSFKSDQKKTFGSFYDYKQYQNDKRKKVSFFSFPYFISGSIYLILSLLAAYLAQ